MIFFKKNWSYIFTGIVILIIFFLRFYHLTILPVFADEAIYIRWAQVMKAEETLRFVPLSDGKEPLFMWVAIAFLKFIKDPLFAGRALSVTTGFGTLVGVSYLSYILFRSKKATLISALIYTTSPFTFFFDRMSLVDSMLSMFGVWTFIFAYLAFTKERLDFAFISGFALGGAWLTKSSALFFVLMAPLLWIFVKSPKRLIKVLPLTFVIWGTAYAMFNILRLGPNFELIASRNMDYVYPIKHILGSPLDPLKPYLLQSLQWIVVMGPWTLLVLGFSGVLANWKNKFKEISVLSIWFLVPIIIQSEYAKVLTARYILFSIPFLIVIAGSFIMLTNKKVLNIAILVFIVSTILSLKFDFDLLAQPVKANLPRSERSGYLEEWTAGQGIKEASDYLRAEYKANPSKKIVVGTEGYFGTLPDGLQIYLNDLRPITVIGIGLDISQIPDQLANSFSHGDKTYLLINNDRFKGDPQKLGLKLIASYPKATRPNDTNESLLFFELQKEKKQL